MHHRNRIAGALAAIAALAAAPAVAGVHSPEVEQRLAYLVGDWTRAGMEATYRDTCRWFDDRAFVVCDTVYSANGKPARSVAIIGWSAADGNFTYQQYDRSGRSRNEICFANAQAGLTCLGERRDGPKLIQTRSHISPSPGGLRISQDRSENGGPWAEAGKVDYVRRKR